MTWRLTRNRAVAVIIIITLMIVGLLIVAVNAQAQEGLSLKMGRVRAQLETQISNSNGLSWSSRHTQTSLSADGELLSDGVSYDLVVSQMNGSSLEMFFTSEAMELIRVSSETFNPENVEIQIEQTDGCLLLNLSGDVEGEVEFCETETLLADELDVSIVRAVIDTDREDLTTSHAFGLANIEDGVWQIWWNPEAFLLGLRPELTITSQALRGNVLGNCCDQFGRCRVENSQVWIVTGDEVIYQIEAVTNSWQGMRHQQRWTGAVRIERLS